MKTNIPTLGILNLELLPIKSKVHIYFGLIKDEIGPTYVIMLCKS